MDTKGQPRPVQLTASCTCAWASDEYPKCRRKWIQTYKSQKGYDKAKKTDFHMVCAPCRSLHASRKSKGVSRGPRGDTLIERVLSQPQSFQDELVTRIKVARAPEENIRFLAKLMEAILQEVQKQKTRLDICSVRCKHESDCPGNAGEQT